MSPTPLERLAHYFSTLRTRQGILARAALGRPDAGDGELARELASAMAAELRPDGSVGGAVVPTIWRAHELLDLGRPPDDPAVGRILGWLLARVGGPGAYGAGCDRVRHSHGACEHWVRGFFAPAPASERLAPITLPNGKAFRAEPAARFAISCLGLRALLRAGLGGRKPAREHLDSLRGLAERWTDWSGFFPPDVMMAGLHALALGGPAYRASVVALVGTAATHQRLDGLWANADPFGLLDALLATGLPEARVLVRRAMPTLTERQREDGTFGTMARQERALIALRALAWVEGSR